MLCNVKTSISSLEVTLSFQELAAHCILRVWGRFLQYLNICNMVSFIIPLKGKEMLFCDTCTKFQWCNRRWLETYLWWVFFCRVVICNFFYTIFISPSDQTLNKRFRFFVVCHSGSLQTHNICRRSFFFCEHKSESRSVARLFFVTQISCVFIFRMIDEIFDSWSTSSQ